MDTEVNEVRVSIRRSSKEQRLSDQAHATLHEFFSRYPAGPVRNSAWMGDGYIEASVFNNRIRLSAVFVMPENRGNHLGSAYLQAFLAVVDEHGVEVECTVAPFGIQVPGTKKGVRELTKWYKSLGFEVVPNRPGRLVRPVRP